MQSNKQIFPLYNISVDNTIIVITFLSMFFVILNRVQSTAHQTIHFGLRIALILMALALIPNYKYIV
jgi:hypothetical protein